MRISFIYSCLMCVLFVLNSCKNVEEKPSENSINSVEEIYNNNEDLLLNNGLKWQANPETTQGVMAMLEHLQAFRNLGLEDYNQLRTDLEDEFKMIFEKCTMKGESHNQLHNYLYPMRDYFSDLSKDHNTAEKAFVALEAYVPQYFDYFE